MNLLSFSKRERHILDVKYSLILIKYEPSEQLLNPFKKFKEKGANKLYKLLFQYKLCLNLHDLQIIIREKGQLKQDAIKITNYFKNGQTSFTIY